MRRLEAQSLEGFNETLIDVPEVFNVKTSDAHEIDYETLIQNTPAITSSYDGKRDPQLVLGTDRGLLSWEEDELYPVGRFSGIHGRNMDVLAGHIAVTDVFGNEYRSLSIKGSDFTDPHFFESATAARKFMIHGLQESLVMERVLRASKVLREHNVATEYICGLSLPEYFPYDKNDVGIDDKTLYELPDFLELLATEFVSHPENIPTGKTSIEVKAEMIERFKDCDYLVSYRAMDCPYRFSEISRDTSYDSFMQFLVEHYDGPGMKEYAEKFDQLYYVMDYFASTFGENIAKMHNAGVTHGFIHESNVTALGSIVDLDSCKGQVLGLGDEQTIDSAKQHVLIMNDVLDSLTTLTHVISRADDDPNKSYVQNLMHQQFCDHWSAHLFLEAYANERYSSKEEKLFFISSLLFVASERKNQPRGLELEILSERLQNLFVTVNDEPASETTDEIPSLDKNINFRKRAEGFLKSVPARFFQERNQSLLDNSWTRNHEYPDAQLEEDEILWPTVKRTTREIALKELVMHCFNHEYVEKPENLFFAINHALGRNVKESHQGERVKQEFDQLYGQVLDSLAKPELNNPQAYLNDYIVQNLSGFADDLANCKFDDDDQKDTAVFYLESDAQYKQLFDIIGLNNSSKIEYTYSQDIPLEDSDMDNTIVVCDYRVAEFVSDQVDNEGILTAMLARRPAKFRPTLLVSGVGTGNITVKLITIEGYDKDEDESSGKPFTLARTAQDLLERVCPSQTKVRQLALTLTD